MSSEMPLSRRRRLSFAAERNMSSAAMRGTAHSAGVEEHITRERIVSELGRSRVWPSADGAGGPHREGEEPKPMMHGRGTSGEAIVAMKPANKAERSAAESEERRAEAKGNAGQQSTFRAQNRADASQALERIRQSRRHSPEVGAVCGKAARTDLCGGRPVMGVPTATAAKARLRASSTRYAPCPRAEMAGTRFALCRPYVSEHGRLHAILLLSKLSENAEETPAAEDAMQETFTALWRRATTYRPERGPAAPWLFAVARNAVVNRTRIRAEVVAHVPDGRVALPVRFRHPPVIAEYASLARFCWPPVTAASIPVAWLPVPPVTEVKSPA